MSLSESHPIWQAAADEPPPTSAVALSWLFTTLAQLRLGLPSCSVDDTTRARLGMPHVRSCRAGGSRADLLVNPETGGAVRVGFDLPYEQTVPTLPRFGAGSRIGSGIA